MFKDIEQPGVGTIRIPGAPATFAASARLEPTPAPELGQHTDEILSAELGLSSDQISALHQAGIVAGPRAS